MSGTARTPPEPTTKPANTNTQERGSLGREQRREEPKRSRSPREDHREKRSNRKDTGFKWKERRREDGDDVADDRRGGRDRFEGLRRGYVDQYKPRDRDRPRSRSPKRYDSYRSGGDRDRRRDNDRDRDQERGQDRSTQRRDRDDRYRPDSRDDRSRREGRDEKPKEKEKKPAPVQPAMPQQEMILVTVNDRLGTKKQIPCLPTDTIKDFKSIVAGMTGRRPHEILLKRQSERPFKDFLTLQDYGISNNVQLDLEVDTGD